MNGTGTESEWNWNGRVEFFFTFGWSSGKPISTQGNACEALSNVTGQSTFRFHSLRIGFHSVSVPTPFRSGSIRYESVRRKGPQSSKPSVPHIAGACQPVGPSEHMCHSQLDYFLNVCEIGVEQCGPLNQINAVVSLYECVKKLHRTALATPPIPPTRLTKRAELCYHKQGPQIQCVDFVS